MANLKIKWQFSCAMFVVGYKPSLATFTSFIKAKWSMLDNLSAILHEDGYFFAKCVSEADVNLIIKGGSVMTGKRPLLIRKWDEHFDFIFYVSSLCGLGS